MPATLLLNGRDLTLPQLVSVARGHQRVALDPDALDRMARSRAIVERLLLERVKVYGLTTGFGSKKNVFIEPAETQQLQRNLVMSHSCGVGDPLDEDVARATLLLRANTLALGLSGIRAEVVQALLDLLHLNIYPFLPSQGSLGASGDLAPLSHLALVLTGDPRGRIFNPARRAGATATRAPGRVERPPLDAFIPSTPETLRQLGFNPVTLEAKEGLALTNGTQVMTAIGLLTLADADLLLTAAEGCAAMSFEALKGVLHAFDPALHAARPHPGQQRSAAALRAFTQGSQILRLPLNMAWINATTRALQTARFHLRDADTPLADDIAANLDDALALLDAVRQDPEAPLQHHPHDPLRAFRDALQPAKAAVLGVYRSLLGAADLGEEAPMALAAVSGALAHLDAAVPSMPPVQDAYSLRCTPQVLGAVRQTLEHARDVLLTEANAATDNPLIFPPTHDLLGNPLPEDLDAWRDALTPDLCRAVVRSGGHVHGEPVALVMDYLAIGLCELANIAERRVAHLVDGHLNNGLPSLLIQSAGLNSGFMIPQYTAASLVSENKALAHPASVDSIPSCENTEDHVSMGTIAARKARSILINAEHVVAIEAFTAFQALHFRQPLTPGVAAQALASLLREHGVRFVAEDRPLYTDIEAIARLIRTGLVAQTLHAAAPTPP